MTKATQEERQGRHWICDLAAISQRERTMYLGEVTFNKSLQSLVKRFENWRRFAWMVDSCSGLGTRPCLESSTLGIHLEQVEICLIRIAMMEKWVPDPMICLVPKSLTLKTASLGSTKIGREDLPNTYDRCRRKRDGNRFAKKKRLKSGGQRHPLLDRFFFKFG